jgi:hypothetical protein
MDNIDNIDDLSDFYKAIVLMGEHFGKVAEVMSEALELFRNLEEYNPSEEV